MHKNKISLAKEIWNSTKKRGSRIKERSFMEESKRVCNMMIRMLEGRGAHVTLRTNGVISREICVGGASSPLIALSNSTCRTNTPLEEISRQTADTLSLFSSNYKMVCIWTVVELQTSQTDFSMQHNETCYFITVFKSSNSEYQGLIIKQNYKKKTFNIKHL